MEPSFLLVARADSSPIIYPLSGKRCVIGRKPHADIVIDHWSVSRNHAVIEQGPSGRWWILDLGSMNGTFVNGTKVTERLLSRGDVVRIGDCTIVLRQPSVMEFPSPMSVGPGTVRLGSDVLRSGPGSERSMLSTVVSSQRIDAEQLASIMSVGRSLLQVEESSARLRTLCTFIVGDMCPAIEAVAIRIAEDGVYEALCEPSVRGTAPTNIAIDAAVIRRFLDKHEPMIASASLNLEVRDASKVRMLIPIAEIGTSVDALSVVLPAQYGTAEWLMLLTLLAEAYQQSELVWDMRHQVRQNAFVERELEMACQIQTGLVPKQFAAPGLSVAFGFEPCRWVGGDYVDALMLPDGRILLAIADVCGNGLQAALVASSVHTLVHASREIGSSLPTLMKRLNEYLLGYLPEHSFVTMLCILIDGASGQMELASAGHPGAIVVRAGRDNEILSQADNVALGVIPADFSTQSSHLDVGDVLLMYTDGVTEMENMKGEPFGIERLAVEFQRIIAVNPLASVESIRRRTTDLCNAYRGLRTAADDRTFLVATRQHAAKTIPVPAGSPEQIALAFKTSWNSEPPPKQ